MEYRSSRLNGGEMLNCDNGFGIHTTRNGNSQHPNFRSVSVGRSSSRENSPAAGVKSSPENSTLNIESGQTAKEKPRRRFLLFQRKNKSNKEQGPTLCSDDDESDSSSSLSSSSNTNKPINNNYLSNSQNRNNLFSTLSRKCSQKFRNLTSDTNKQDKTKNESNSHKSESQNGNHGTWNGDIEANHTSLSISSNNVKRQPKPDGHYGKFDLFSSCRKVPGSPRESLDSISRRVRKDALKARVEAQREQQYRDSSSDDEEQFTEREAFMRRYHSDESLHQRWLGDRQAKANRTERYYRRKLKDDDSSSKFDSNPTSGKEFVSNPAYVRRNLTISGGTQFSTSPSPSPQLRVDAQRGGAPIGGQTQQRSNYSKYEEITTNQSIQYSTSGNRTSQRNREERFTENIVVSGYLPLRKANVIDGHFPRAPTPPLRSSTYPAQPRPQSFNLEDINIANGGRQAWANGNNSPGPNTLVMSSSDAPINGSGRPLSFTSTSHVIYNHNPPNTQRLPVNGEYVGISTTDRIGKDKNSRQSLSPETPPAAYMSDSQILGRSRSSRANRYEATWKKQSQQLYNNNNKNFNSVPRPWNTYGMHDDSFSSDIQFGTSNARPPPSPSKMSESFTYGSGSSGALSPKYTNNSQTKINSTFRNQHLQSNRRRENGTGMNNGDLGRFMLVTSPPLPPTRKYYRQQQSLSSNLESVGHRLGKLVNGSNNNKGKSSDNHLEDALLELEKIYHSMKNEEEEVDERLSCKGRRNSTCEDLLLHSNYKKNEGDKGESDVNLDGNGVGCYNTLDGRPRSAQGNRNNSLPNKITDDLAYRKIARQSEFNSRPTYMATGSYLLRSPALSPSVSADDVRAFKNTSVSHTTTTNHEPDTIYDDLSFRNLRDANLQKVIDPQPPFGIPIGPITNAASSDYMHAQAQDLSRPKMRRRFRPDVVKDDLAYRNLRKDGNNDKNDSMSSRLNFDELDNILSGEFQQMIDPNRKKHRAARSLSANLSQIICQNKLLGTSTSSTANKSNNTRSNGEKSSSVTDLRSTDDIKSDSLDKINQPPPLLNDNNNKINENNASSSSTDTLTDLGSTQSSLVPPRQKNYSLNNESAFRPLSANENDITKSTNDIWQVRVTVGSEPVVTDIRYSTQQVVTPAEKGLGHVLVRPIPLKLDAARGHRFENVIDDKAKGSPIDEVKLDELLNSLALDTVQPPPKVTCNGQHLTNGSNLINEKVSDNKSSTGTFPALVTMDGNGEMSVKILFPHLKSPINGTHEAVNEEQGRSVNRVVTSGSSRGDAADGRSQREMSVFPVRPRVPISNQCVDEKFVSSRNNVRSPLTIKKERASPVNLKRSTAFNVKNSGNNRPSESSNIKSASAMPDSESQTERIARYKEERRKQLANQYGQWSSKDENSSLGNEPSYMRFSQRNKKKPSDALTGFEGNKNLSKSGGHEFENGGIKSAQNKDVSNATTKENSQNNESTPKELERTSSPVDGMVRLNRASRLRAQARTNESNSPELSRVGSFRNKTAKTDGPSKDVSPIKPLNRSGTPVSSSSEVPVNSAHLVRNGQILGHESESGGTASDSTTGRMKDKSSKRKSHLNRMGSVDNTPIPSDSGDDTSRRFRRQRNSFADKSSNCSTDGIQSDSLKSTRATRIAQTPLTASASKTDHKINITLAKNEIEFGTKILDNTDETSESDSDLKNKLSTHRNIPTQRPEIPDIFRSKVVSVTEKIVTNVSETRFSSTHDANLNSELASSPGAPKDDLKSNLSASVNSFFLSSQKVDPVSNAQKTIGVAQTNELKISNFLDKLSDYSIDQLVDRSVKTKDMGGKIFKDSPNSGDTDDASSDTNFANSFVNNDVGHSEDVKSESNGSNHYDPSGNWHLGKSSLSDIYAFDNELEVRTNKFMDSTLSSLNEPVNNESRAKNRMAVAYGNKDASNDESEASGWANQSSPVSKKKIHSLNFNVTIPVNNEELCSRKFITDDNERSSLEKETKTKHLEGDLGSVVASPRRKKSSDEVEFHTKSILKSKEDLRTVDGKPPIPHSILKRGSIEESMRSRSPEKCSILKKKGSSEESDHRSDSPEIVSILRRKSAEELEDSSVSSDRQSILRRKSMLDETEHSRTSEFHSILKKQGSLDVMDISHSEPRPILKKKNSTEEYEQYDPKPILKKRSSTEEEYEEKPRPTGILKLRRRSGQEDLLEDESTDQVELRRANRMKTSSPPVLRFRHLEDELPLVPNRLSSSNSRHVTSSEEEFLSVSSSPGSWAHAKSFGDDENLTTTQRISWEKKEDNVFLMNGEPRGVGAERVDSKLFHPSSHLLPSKFEEENVRGEKASSSSSESSSEEEEEEEEEESEEENDSEESTDESEKTIPTASSITIGKIELTKNTSVQETSDHLDEKPLKEMPTGTSSSIINQTNGSESVHKVPNENVTEKFKPSLYLTNESEQKSTRNELNGTFISSVTVKEEAISKISKVNQISASSEVAEEGEDVTRMSVAERASLFMQKLKNNVKSDTASSSTGASRFTNRRGLQRSQTQPVTVCEVNEASKIAEESVKRQRNGVDYDDVTVAPKTETNQVKNGPSESDEDPSKLSLRDRVKLFNQKMIEERLPTRRLSSTEDDTATTTAIPKERQRRAMASRFKTQPVTSEELEKAQLISAFESKNNQSVEKEVEENSSSQSSSTDDQKIKGILKKKEEALVSHIKSTMSVESKNGGLVNVKGNAVTKSIETKTAGISMSNRTSTVTELKSILKMDSFIKQASSKSFQDKDEPSSSSSDNEDESEGISINVRNTNTSRGSTDEESSNHSQSSLSSGGKQEQGKRIKNEAVLRRRNAALRKQEERKCAESQQIGVNISQSFEFTSSALRSVLSGEIIQNRKIPPQRSSTQPLTQMEKDGVSSEIKGGSIAERLAALKASQEEDWKRRLERNKGSEVDGSATIGSSSSGEETKMIHEKVTLLEGSQQEWKRRVEEKDATKFTVAGKMGKMSPPQESPVLERRKRIPKPTRFQSKTCANLPELAKCSPTPPLPVKSTSITRSKSMSDAKANTLEEKSVTKVSIPKADDEGFSSFFESVNFDKLKSQKIEIPDEAFNQIVSESRQFLVQRRSVHVTRRHVGTRNPLKTLAAREDIRNEYTEIATGVAEKELKRLRVEQLAKHSDLARSALAGLASTEDFTSVSLRKSSSVINATLLPYKELMLIQVKGRRQIQCRLVDPNIASLNKGDNFILVTPNEVYNWIGEFSNVIERVKGAEIANIIFTKKDLGFKGSNEVVTFDEEKHTGGRGKRRDFFEHLGGQDDIADPGSPEDDEIYEAAITETNKIYLVEGNELVPYEKYWGCPLRTEMLKSTEVIIFDFGSEMYVWQGKLAQNDLKKKAIHLAQELWDDGYDYSECDVSPISPCRNNLPKYGKKRPPWALYSKVNQHMETVLFRSKFLDWPDLERVIQIKRQESETKSESLADLQPYDAQLMIDTKPLEPDLVLENCHLGRGVHYWDESERRQCNIATLGVKIWHISEFNHSIIPLESRGYFFSCDTYVVRWQYRVAVTGRDLTGKVSRHSSLGRERCAYFFWQGCHSTINEKGASALMTVELDEERGPHIRVDQGQESPCFLNLFEGKMIIFNGKRDSDSIKNKWRLFIVRGEYENEVHLLELECAINSLREGGSFVLVDCAGGIVYLWTGKHVSNHSKEVARFAVENIVQRRPNEMGFELGKFVDMKEEEQGAESNEFLTGLGNVSKKEIQSLLRSADLQPLRETPRLFHMTSVLGSFLVSEVLCSFRTLEHVISHPFLQSDIYSATQPSIFLLDHDNEIYVWQGWWPETNDENEASGSAHLRWNVERRLAMETAMNYCNAKKNDSPPKAFTVWAGLEPLEFKHCFPEWIDVTEAAERNKMNGRKDGEKKLVVDVLTQLNRTRYSLAELKEKPLPEGVDPSIIETYLTDDEFEDVLKSNKEEFYSLPPWKQTNIKKSAGLY